MRFWREEKLLKEYGCSEEGESEPAEKGKKEVYTPDGGMNQDPAEGEVTFQPRQLRE
jgi:hypothetical protein